MKRVSSNKAKTLLAVILAVGSLLITQTVIAQDQAPPPAPGWGQGMGPGYGPGWGKGRRGKGRGRGMIRGPHGPRGGMMGPPMAPFRKPGPAALGIEIGLLRSDKIGNKVEALVAQVVYRALNLSPKQKKALKAQINRVRKLRKQADSIRAKYEKKLIPLLKRAEQEARKGQVSKTTQKEIAKLRHAYAEETRPIRDTAFEIVDQLYAIVSPQQAQAAIKALATMWGPEPPESDSVSPWALAFLDRLRLMPQTRLDRMKQRVYDRLAAGTLPLTRDQVDDFFSFVDQVRALSADDYENRREELAAEIDPALLDLLQRRWRAARAGRGMGPGMGAGRVPGQPPAAPAFHRGARLLLKIVVSDSFYRLLK